MAFISSFDLEARISMRQASSVPAPCKKKKKKNVNDCALMSVQPRQLWREIKTKQMKTENLVAELVLSLG